MYSKDRKGEAAFEFDADSLAFDMGNEPVRVPKKPAERVELTPQDVKDAHWFYDTPGISKENCVGTWSLGRSSFHLPKYCVNWRNQGKTVTSTVGLVVTQQLKEELIASRSSSIW